MPPAHPAISVPTSWTYSDTLSPGLRQLTLGVARSVGLDKCAMTCPPSVSHCHCPLCSARSPSPCPPTTDPVARVRSAAASGCRGVGVTHRAAFPDGLPSLSNAHVSVPGAVQACEVVAALQGSIVCPCVAAFKGTLPFSRRRALKACTRFPKAQEVLGGARTPLSCSQRAALLAFSAPQTCSPGRVRGFTGGEEVGITGRDFPSEQRVGLSGGGGGGQAPSLWLPHGQPDALSLWPPAGGRACSEQGQGHPKNCSLSFGLGWRVASNPRALCGPSITCSPNIYSAPASCQFCGWGHCCLPSTAPVCKGLPSKAVPRGEGTLGVARAVQRPRSPPSVTSFLG